MWRGKRTPMRSQESLLCLVGELAARRAGLAVSTRGFYLGSAAKMRNTLVMLVWIYVFLSFWTSCGACMVQKSVLPLYALGILLYVKGLPQWHTGGGKLATVYEHIARHHRTNAFNVLPTCPLTLSGTDGLEIRRLPIDREQSILVPPGWVGELLRLLLTVEGSQSGSNGD